MDKLQTEFHNLVAGVTGAEQVGFIDISQQSLYGKSSRYLQQLHTYTSSALFDTVSKSSISVYCLNSIQSNLLEVSLSTNQLAYKQQLTTIQYCSTIRY